MQSFLGEGSHSKFVQSTTEGIFKDMRAEHKASPKMLSAVDGIEADVMGWVKGRETATKATLTAKEPMKEAAKLEASGMSALVERLDTRLKDTPADLTPKESVALQDMVTSIATSTAKGCTMGILSSGRDGNQVQLFVKAPTSLGKTLLAYEGLLPYLEAEAASAARSCSHLQYQAAG